MTLPLLLMIPVLRNRLALACRIPSCNNPNHERQHHIAIQKGELGCSARLADDAQEEETETEFAEDEREVEEDGGDKVEADGFCEVGFADVGDVLAVAVLDCDAVCDC